jgi:hypothetical protein
VARGRKKEIMSRFCGGGAAVVRSLTQMKNFGAFSAVGWECGMGEIRTNCVLFTLSR